MSRDTNMQIYTVKSGDTLWAIARQFGHASPDVISKHPENESIFIEGNRNNYRISPGDKLVIPKVKAFTKNIDVNTRKVFRRSSKKAFIRLNLVDVIDEKLTKFRYEVDLVTHKVEGDETTSEGVIEIEVPHRAEENGRVHYWPYHLTSQERSELPKEDLERISPYVAMKLYSDDSNPNNYHDIRINLKFSPRSETEGQLMQLANDLRYLGYVEIENPDKSIITATACYPEKNLSKSNL